MQDRDADAPDAVLTQRGWTSVATLSSEPARESAPTQHSPDETSDDGAIHWNRTIRKAVPSVWDSTPIDATLSAALGWPGEAQQRDSSSGDLASATTVRRSKSFVSTRFGDYELLEEVARGGMGVVYKARQVSLDRIVALKMILGGRFADPAEIRSLYAEAETIARLNHPNIVRVHEVGEHQGHHYFSMEFVEGPTLGDVIRDCRPRFLDAARIVRILARSIHVAHQNGVLHRDLKPTNILVDRQRRLRITDFGVAKRLNQSGVMTTAGRVTGTPAYMPPEQAAGASENLGPHSDVYGLGAILYEMLTGRPPFTGATTVDVLDAVQNKDPVRPSLIEPSVPRDLETICLTCLAKDPRRRYATAEHLAADLDRLLAHQKIKAKPPGLVACAMKWCRQAPVLATTLLLSALMVLAAGFGLMWHTASLAYEKELKQRAADLAVAERQKAEQQRAIALRETERARQLLVESNKQRKRAETRELEARRYLYAVRMADIRTAWQQSDMQRVNSLLADLEPEQGQADLRGFEWHYFWQLGHSERASLAAHQGLVTAVVYSPDGMRMATAGLDGMIHIWNAADHTLLKSLSAPGEGITSLVSRPGASQLWIVAAGGCDGTVSLWEGDTGRHLSSIAAHEGSVTALTFSADGSRLLSGGSDKTIRQWDPISGQLKNKYGGNESPIRGLSVSGDGQWMASAAEDKTLRLWNLDRGGLVQSLTCDDVPTCVAFGPSSQRLLVGCRNGSLRLWDVRQLSATKTLKSEHGPITALAFGPRGQTVAIATANQKLLLVDPNSWQAVRVLRGHCGELTDVCFSPDGLEVATTSTDGTAKVWGLDTPQPYRTLGASLGATHCMAVSPDGRLIASAAQESPDGPSRLVLQSAEDGQTLSGWSLPTGTVHRLSFSADGQQIAAAIENSEVRGGEILVWHIEDRSHTPLHYRGPHEAFVDVAFSRENDCLVAGTRNGNLVCWTVGQTSAPRILVGENDSLRSLSLTDDGQQVAVGYSSGRIRVWDLTSGRVMLDVWGGGDKNPVAFSPDGTWLLAARALPQLPSSPGMSVHWQPPYEIATHRLVGRVGEASLVDVTTGHESFSLHGHTDDVTCVAFTPSGDRLVTGSVDGTIRFWDATTGQHVATLTAHLGGVEQIAFSADGRTLVSCGADGVVRLWPTAKSQPLGDPPTTNDQLASVK
jgi:WD40 repeat protein/predicted Ser/Thr protein kinase